MSWSTTARQMVVAAAPEVVEIVTPVWLPIQRCSGQLRLCEGREEGAVLEEGE
jgi:hypothetical protein